MNNKFRKLHDYSEIVNIIKYVKEFLKEHKDEDIKLYLGTDSQNKRKTTMYATVLSFRFPNKGVHAVYFKKSIDKEKVKFTRLYNELTLTIDTALWFRKNGVEIDFLEFDFNPDQEKGNSNELISSAEGLSKGHYFTPLVKPECQISTRIADSLVKPGRS